MALLDIRGVRVNFPFTPYPCQVTYMEKVLECMQQEENGVLESPTGTGKTLSLLCATLAWLEGRKAQIEFSRQAGMAAMLAEAGKENLGQSTLTTMAASLQKSTGSTAWGSSEFVVPKIIYASRTHSQLSQAVQELKRTSYNGMKTAIIGSRDQLCINEQVKKEKNNSAKVHMCRAKVAGRRCHYYNVLEDLKRNTEVRQVVGSIADIEDLVTHGNKSKLCPYYLARELKSDADIIFMPYNYLLDPKSRKAHGVELQGNIVIFDEAHNLEQICEESASLELSSVDLATAIEETTQLGIKLTELVSSEADIGDTGDSTAQPEFTIEDIIKLKKTLLELEELIDAVPLKNKEVVKPGIFMFELMAKVNITFGSKNIVTDLMLKMISHLNSGEGTSSALHSKGAGLSKVADAIRIIFNQEPGDCASISQHMQSLAQHYKVHIQLKEKYPQKKKLDSWASTGEQDKAERVLSYWCFSPGFSMQDLKSQGVKSIILTSGTLSPLDSFTAEMQIPFNVRLENPHVIEKHQVWVGALKVGPDGTTLNSNYQNRSTESYQASLGNSIVNFARVVPNGLLVFFPSYPVMDKCVEYWQSCNIWERILAYKPVMLEPRGKDAFTVAIEDFYEKINDIKLNGAIFMAVCRGKVSEGLDFADNNGRAVVITGLPFPPMKDPRVILKMQHLDDLRGKQGYMSLTGQQWYRQQATRAVNQAVGRVIRHKDDFGAIMLCDTRFSSSESIRGLPAWLKPYVSNYDNFGKAVRDMLSFFKVAEKTLPNPQTRNNRKKSGSASLGCDGAYFEPTASRRLTAVGQASEVICHVPGLRRHKSTEDVMVSLKGQYSGTSNPATQRRGLLHALDSTERPDSSMSFQHSEISSASLQGSVKINPKKRKIVVKPNQSSTSSSSRQESSSVNTTATNTSSATTVHRTGVHLNLAENYLAEVKAVLNMSDYKQFSSALQEYKKSECLSTVTSVLAHLFTASTDHFHLFRKFYRFVRPKHKAEFDQLCRSLTGESCGYKPEHAVAGKRLAHNDAVEEKRQKLESASGSGSSSLGQWSASQTSHNQSSTFHPPSALGHDGSGTSSFAGVNKTNTASLQERPLSKEATCAPQHEPSCMKISGDNTCGDRKGTQTNLPAQNRLTVTCARNQNDLLDLSGQNRHDGGNGRNECDDRGLSAQSRLSEDRGRKEGISEETTASLPRQTQGSLANSSAGPSQHGVNRSQVTSVSCDVQSADPDVAGKTAIEKIHSMQNEVSKFHPKSGYICRNCGKEAHVPFQLNSCEHVCCFRCWRQILEGDKLCPHDCSQPVRKRHLRQLLFASGDEVGASVGQSCSSTRHPTIPPVP